MGWKNGCVRSALGARGRHCFHAGREGWTLGSGKQGAVDPQGVGEPGSAPSQSTETPLAPRLAWRPPALGTVLPCSLLWSIPRDR